MTYQELQDILRLRQSAPFGYTPTLTDIISGIQNQYQPNQQQFSQPTQSFDYQAPTQLMPTTVAPSMDGYNLIPIDQVGQGAQRFTNQTINQTQYQDKPFTSYGSQSKFFQPGAFKIEDFIAKPSINDVINTISGGDSSGNSGGGDGGSTGSPSEGFTIGPDGFATPNTVSPTVGQVMGTVASMTTGIPGLSMLGKGLVNSMNFANEQAAMAFNVAVNDTTAAANNDGVTTAAATPGTTGTGGAAASAASAAAAAAAAAGHSDAAIGAASQAAANAAISGATPAAQAQAASDAAASVDGGTTGPGSATGVGVGSTTGINGMDAMSDAASASAGGSGGGTSGGVSGVGVGSADGVNGMDAASDSASAGGGGAGGSKIICTAMNHAYGFGSFRNAIWIAYSDKHLTKAHEVGYHTLFLPLVDFGFKRGDAKPNLIVRKILEWGTRHRSMDIRAEMRGTKRDKTGQAIRFVFEPLCYFVGKLKGY